MAVEALVARYGLAAVLLGAGIEGETMVLAGGLFASRHVLALPAVAAAAAIGSFAADQAFFLLGRHFRDDRRVRRQLDKPAAEKALNALERHPNGFILGFRFLYGLRTISPIVVGASDVPTAKFLLLNAIAATLWAWLFACVGYALGDRLKAMSRHAPSTAVLIAILIAVLAVLAIGGRLAWKVYHRPR